MIAIGETLISDDVIEAHFVCDLNKCKGGCCVDGDCGAPLTEEETKLVAENYPKIKKYLPQEYIDEVEKQGTHTMDDEFGYVTPTVNGGVCVYAYTDFAGIVKCGFEKAHLAGEIEFKKPISCHLYPIRIKKMEGYDAVNYSPREPMCNPACQLGDKLKVPVYQFLKDAIVRKYGEEYFHALDATAKKIKSKL